MYIQIVEQVTLAEWGRTVGPEGRNLVIQESNQGDAGGRLTPGGVIVLAEVGGDEAMAL